MKIAILGGGTMGEAIVKSILRKKLADRGGYHYQRCNEVPA